MRFYSLPAFLIMLFAWCDAHAYGIAESPLDPKSYTSPSGEYVWKVNPSEMFGRGEATYLLTHKGKLLWKGNHPFTLRDAQVTDNGLLAGYGYTQGVEGVKRDDGHFQVAIIDTNGQTRLNRKEPRKPSRFLHTDADPMADGIVVNGFNDRFIVRVGDSDINRGQESWWTYQLSSGQLIGEFPLKSPDPHVNSPSQARAIPGTPLVLLSYWRYERPDIGVRFAIVDENSAEVWGMSLPRDYQGIDDQMRYKVRAEGAISDVRSNHFTVASIATSEDITFEVERSQEQPAKWIVEEVARKKVSPPATNKVVDPPFPAQPLKLLGTFSFGEDKAGVSAIRSVVHFDINAQGQIGFIRMESDNKFSFVCVDAKGKVLRETPIDAPQALVTNTHPKVAALTGNRWVIVAAAYGIKPVAAAWWLDGESGELTPIPGFVCPSVKSIVGSREGGFVILAMQRSSAYLEDQLIAYDKNARREWIIKEDSNEGENALFSPEDITVTTSGKIAVVSNVREALQFFSAGGEFLKAYKLEDIWGREPSYPSDISADPNDGVIIGDFQGKPPVIRMNSAGKALTEFELKQEDGRIVEATRGIRVDPSGRVWVCDGESFFRVSESGVVEFVIGAPPALDHLGKISTTTVDSGGRLYAVDERTSAVHVYDQHGKRLLICKPDASDFSGTVVMPHLTVSSDGQVYLMRDSSYPTEPDYLQFASDGKRIGTKTFGLGGVREYWHAFPKTNRFLVIEYHDAFLTDSSGKVIRTIQRRPDDRWLGYPSGASISPDGSFAIFTGNDYSPAKSPEVHLYDGDGTPIRTFSLPQGCRVDGATYTGKMIATRSATDICLIDTNGKPVLKFPLPMEKSENLDNENCQFFTAQGRELWLVREAKKSAWRFELPTTGK